MGKNVDSKQSRTQLDKALLLSGFGKVMAENSMNLKTIVGPHDQGLSIGQEQKLAICRAIFLREGLLLFDEPTSAFDEKSEEEFFGAVNQLAEENIVIINTHSQKFASEFSNVIDLWPKSQSFD